MPYAKNQDINIHYEIQGHGAPLVLMHGTTGCLEDWIDFGYVKILSLHYQCILIDARGHGESDKPMQPDDYSLKNHVDDVVAVLDDLNIEKAHYVGYSRGGWIGFGLAKYYQQRFHSLILGGAQPFESGKAIERLNDAFKDGVDGFIGYTENIFGPTPEPRRTRLLNTDLEPIRISIQRPREDISDCLSKITIPTLIYCGKTDPLYYQVKKAAELIPKSQFLTLANMHHMQAMENGEEIAPHFLEFLNGIS